MLTDNLQRRLKANEHTDFNQRRNRKAIAGISSDDLAAIVSEDTLPDAVWRRPSLLHGIASKSAMMAPKPPAFATEGREPELDEQGNLTAENWAKWVYENQDFLEVLADKMKEEGNQFLWAYLGATAGLLLRTARRNIGKIEGFVTEDRYIDIDDEEYEYLGEHMGDHLFLRKGSKYDKEAMIRMKEGIIKATKEGGVVA